MYGLEQEPVHGGDHEHLVAAFAAFAQPKTYVEVGAYRGSTFRLAARHARERAFAIDTDEAALAYCQALTRESFPAKIDLFFLAVDGATWLKDQRDDSVDMVFLDASHEWDATRVEVRECLRVLAPNGLLLMHDTYPPNDAQAKPGYCGEAWRVAEELSWDVSKHQVVTVAAQYGLTIVRKAPFGHHLAWKR